MSMPGPILPVWQQLLIFNTSSHIVTCFAVAVNMTHALVTCSGRGGNACIMHEVICDRVCECELNSVLL